MYLKFCKEQEEEEEYLEGLQVQLRQAGWGGHALGRGGWRGGKWKMKLEILLMIGMQ